MAITIRCLLCSSVISGEHVGEALEASDFHMSTAHPPGSEDTT